MKLFLADEWDSFDEVCSGLVLLGLDLVCSGQWTLASRESRAEQVERVPPIRNGLYLAHQKAPLPLGPFSRPMSRAPWLFAEQLCVRESQLCCSAA